MVRVEDARPDLEVDVERCVDPLRLHPCAPPAGEEQRSDAEQLGDPDRRDGDDQPRRVEEPPDDEELDRNAEDCGRREPDPEPEIPAQPRLDDQHHRQHGREQTEFAGGEVEHPVGAVDEVHPERHEARDQPEDDSGEQRAGRCREPDLLDHDEHDRPGQPRHPIRPVGKLHALSLHTAAPMATPLRNTGYCRVGSSCTTRCVGGPTCRVAVQHLGAVRRVLEDVGLAGGTGRVRSGAVRRERREDDRSTGSDRGGSQRWVVVEAGQPERVDVTMASVPMVFAERHPRATVVDRGVVSANQTVRYCWGSTYAYPLSWCHGRSARRSATVAGSINSSTTSQPCGGTCRPARS